MTKVLIMPALAAALFAVACGDGDPAEVDTSASVRFFNATTDMTGSAGFTANGQYAGGSALAFGQSSQTCTKLDAGTVSFGFGAANTGGTGLNGNELIALNNQTIATSGNYTMVAAGSASSPRLYLLDNSFSGVMTSSQAAVRFVNLAPGPNPLPYVFYVFAGGLPPEGQIVEASLIVGAPSSFKAVNGGNNTYTIIIGHQLETLRNITVNVQAGTVNTIAIVPDASGGHTLINIPRC